MGPAGGGAASGLAAFGREARSLRNPRDSPARETVWQRKPAGSCVCCSPELAGGRLLAAAARGGELLLLRHPRGGTGKPAEASGSVRGDGA